MTEIDGIIEDIRLKGYSLMPDEEAALRTISDMRMLKSAVAMADTSPMVLNVIVQQAVEQYRRLQQARQPPEQAGGENKMVQDALGPSGPKPMTLEELMKMIPEAAKKATEFEKAPVWEPKVGDAIIVRLKRVHQGSYKQPLVVVDEFGGYVDGKIGGTVKWAKKDVKGNVLESGEIPTAGTVKQDLRLPTFAVTRAMEQDVKLVEKMVYFFQVVGEKETQYPNPYRQVVVMSLGQAFPK